MTKDVGHLLMCFLAICKSPFVKALLMNFTPNSFFLIIWFHYLIELKYLSLNSLLILLKMSQIYVCINQIEMTNFIRICAKGLVFQES